MQAGKNYDGYRGIFFDLMTFGIACVVAFPYPCVGRRRSPKNIIRRI